VTGEDRVAFLQGQLTQEMRGLSPGEARPAAGLTPKGKLVFIAGVVGLPEEILLLVPEACRETARSHLAKYAAFHRVSVLDRTEEFMRVGLYGPGSAGIALPEGAWLLPPEGELAGEVLAPSAERRAVEGALARAGSVPVAGETAEALRIEAGRPRFGQDADASHLPDEAALGATISSTKGCYVGQEVVARLRTYGRVNKRLIGFRFPQGALPAGAVLKRPEAPEPEKIEMGRVTSAGVSPRLGPIGLGYAFREVVAGDRLVSVLWPARSAVVTALPFL